MEKVLAKSNFSIWKILSAVKDQGILSEEDSQLILKSLVDINTLFPILSTDKIDHLTQKIEESATKKHLMILVAAEQMLPSYWENLDCLDAKFNSKDFLLKFSHEIVEHPNMARIRLVMAAILSSLESRQNNEQTRSN